MLAESFKENIKKGGEKRSLRVPLLNVKLKVQQR